MVVRFRIDGLLRIMYIFNKEEFQIVLSKIKINSNIDITEKRKPQDGKISFEYKEKSYDLRVSTMPTIFGEKVVIRILYGNDFDSGLMEVIKERVKEYIPEYSYPEIILTGDDSYGVRGLISMCLDGIHKKCWFLDAVENR